MDTSNSQKKATTVDGTSSLDAPPVVQFADRSPSIIPSPIYNSPAPTTFSSPLSINTPTTPPIASAPSHYTSDNINNNMTMPLPSAPAFAAAHSTSTVAPPASHVPRTTMTGSMHRGNFASDTFKQDKVLSEESTFGASTNNSNNHGFMNDDEFEDIHEMHTRGGGTGRSFGGADDNKGGFLPLATREEDEELQQHNNNSNNGAMPLQRGQMMMNEPTSYGNRRSPLMRLLLGPNQRPWFSWISAAVMLGVLVYELVRNAAMTGSVIQTSPNFNPMIGPSFYTLINLGAKFTPCMRSIPGYTTSMSFQDCYRTGETCTLDSLCGFGGLGDAPNQTFRLFYPIFMHAGIVHFLMNMLTHLRLGVDLERALGLPRYLLLYIASGLFGNVLSSMLAQPTQASMGASGALFGLIGYMFVDVIVNWKVIPNPVRELVSLLISTIISLVLGLLPGLDNFCHLGGFVVGLVMGMMIAPMRPMASTRAKWITWGLRVVSLVVLIILFAVCITTFYNSVDPSQICPGCKYLSCLPVNNWCDY